jgi:hypothetical protein
MDRGKGMRSWMDSIINWLWLIALQAATFKTERIAILRGGMVLIFDRINYNQRRLAGILNIEDFLVLNILLILEKGVYSNQESTAFMSKQL